MTDGRSPDDAGLAEEASGWRSAYVHIPFCARVCPYCDFAVLAGADDRMDGYIDALITEIETEPSWEQLHAVFVGGGTPSRVPASGLGRILAAVDSRYGMSDQAEVTLEANPEDWNHGFAESLVAAGFNRVSFGVQSFDPAVLAALGRAHTPVEADSVVGVARDAGFRSVSVDLIYGHPAESASSWDRTLDRAIAADPDHISAYSLTVEPGTELWRQVRKGAPSPDSDVQADRWEAASAKLGPAGYVRYEVSNHARRGHGCRYNLSVWGQGEYLGFGLGAHGHRNGVRSARVRRLDTYIARVMGGIGAVQSTDVMEGWDAELERLMLGLRRTAGVQMGSAGAMLLASPDGPRLVDAGVLGVEGDRLIARNALLTDEIIRTVLGLESGEQR